jgi:hypothetical protein
MNPHLKRLMTVIGLALVTGPVIAAVVGLVHAWTGVPNTAADVSHVPGLVRSAWTGVAYAVPFYVCCALPAPVVRRYVAGMPSVACALGTTLVALAGAVPAYFTAGILLGRWPGRCRCRV